MNIRSLTSTAKRLIDRRGGTEALAADAGELKDIATGGGSMGDKARRAVNALRDPGAPGDERARSEAAPDRRTTRPPQEPPAR